MFNKFIKYVFLLTISLYIVLLFVKPALPTISKISDQVIKTAPIQNKVNIIPIERKYGDYTYKITPLYSYEIYGVVVAEYSSRNWLDITHKKDPANTRDLCVVWGDNISSNAYQKVKYRHGEFTCYYSYSRNFDPPFKGNLLSNNHLISEDSNIEKQVSRVNIGDQIHIKGYLANYEISDKDGKLQSFRNTSTTREDSGNGACEIIYVNEIETIEKGNAIYYLVKSLLPFVILLCGGYFFIRLFV
jgi:hypothetical protein